jgi:hypothetical protein
MLKKPENVASSFDRLRMRPDVFNGLNLMVSLSNHKQNRFSAACKKGTAWPRVISIRLLFVGDGIGRVVLQAGQEAPTALAIEDKSV